MTTTREFPLARRLRRDYSKERLQLMFVERTHDRLFAEVGRELYPNRMYADEHREVWDGYEYVTDSGRWLGPK